MNQFIQKWHLNLYIHSFIYHEMHTLWFCQCGVEGIVNLWHHIGKNQRFTSLIPNLTSCNAFGGNSTGAIVSNCKNIWINLRQVSKATTHGQHAQILLPHFMHLKQFECFLFWPSDSCQLQEFNCWVCKGILHHWHSHHPKSTCSLHSHHWAEFLELDKKKHGMFQEL